MSVKFISDHITYWEAIKSITARRKGIDNTPPKDLILNMMFVAITVFEPVRIALGSHPIGVASFYRCPQLNEAVGGSENSQHPLGQAIDMDADVFGFITNRQIFDWIYENAIFDQLIWEFGTSEEPEWVHVSKTIKENRRETLVSFKKDGLTHYKYYKAA